jgi:hypothetical protein
LLIEQRTKDTLVGLFAVPSISTDSRKRAFRS